MITIDLTIYGVIVALILLTIGLSFYDIRSILRNPKPKQSANDYDMWNDKVDEEAIIMPANPNHIWVTEFYNPDGNEAQQDRINNTQHEMD